MLITQKFVLRFIENLPTFFATLLLAISIFAVTSLSPASSIAAPPVEKFVATFGNQIIKILGNNSSRTRQEAQLKTAFLRNVDIGTISRFTLGKYSRNIKNSDRRKFNKLLGRFIVKVFMGRLRGTMTSGMEIRGTRILKKGRDYIVKSDVIFQNGASVRVAWRVLRRKGGRLRIFDVRIAGLWMAQEQRSTFVNIIGRNNGKIAPLLAYLQSQIDQPG